MLFVAAIWPLGCVLVVSEKVLVVLVRIVVRLEFYIIVVIVHRDVVLVPAIRRFRCKWSEQCIIGWKVRKSKGTVASASGHSSEAGGDVLFLWHDAVLLYRGRNVHPVRDSEDLALLDRCRNPVNILVAGTLLPFPVRHTSFYVSRRRDVGLVQQRDDTEHDRPNPLGRAPPLLRELPALVVGSGRVQDRDTDLARL